MEGECDEEEEELCVVEGREEEGDLGNGDGKKGW